MRLALPAAHPLGRRRSRSRGLSLQADQDFILVRRPGQPGLYETWLEACRRAGFEPRIVAEVPRMPTDLNLAAAGLGVSVAPATMRPMLASRVRYLGSCGRQACRAPLTLLHRERERDLAVQALVAQAIALAAERRG